MTDLPELRIRDARDADRPEVREITLAAYAEFGRVMAPAAWAGLERAVRAGLESTEPAERIVAERDGRLVGSVMLFPPASDAYGGLTDAPAWPELRLLAVRPEERGRGVGKVLVDECVRRARASGATELGLHTSESLKVAIRMYERMGFQRAPEFDFQPEGAELVTAYRLDLSDPTGRPG